MVSDHLMMFRCLIEVKITERPLVGTLIAGPLIAVAV